jgi:hypothetical protein
MEGVMELIARRERHPRWLVAVKLLIVAESHELVLGSAVFPPPRHL